MGSLTPTSAPVSASGYSVSSVVTKISIAMNAMTTASIAVIATVYDKVPMAIYYLDFVSLIVPVAALIAVVT